MPGRGRRARVTVCAENGGGDAPQASPGLTVVEGFLSRNQEIQPQYAAEAPSAESTRLGGSSNRRPSSAPWSARSSATFGGDRWTRRPPPRNTSTKTQSLLVPIKSRWFASDDEDTEPAATRLPTAKELEASAPETSSDAPKETAITGESSEPPRSAQNPPKLPPGTTSRRDLNNCSAGSEASGSAPKGTCPRFPNTSAKGETLIQITVPRGSNAKQLQAVFRGPVRRPPAPLPRTYKGQMSKQNQEDVLIGKALEEPTHLTEDERTKVAAVLVQRALLCSKQAKSVAEHCLRIIQRDSTSTFEESMVLCLERTFNERQHLENSSEEATSESRRWTAFLTFLADLVVALGGYAGHAGGGATHASTVPLATILCDSLFLKLGATLPGQEAELELVGHVLKKAGETLSKVLPFLLAALRMRLRAVFCEKDSPIAWTKLKEIL